MISERAARLYERPWVPPPPRGSLLLLDRDDGRLTMPAIDGPKLHMTVDCDDATSALRNRRIAGRTGSERATRPNHPRRP